MNFLVWKRALAIAFSLFFAFLFATAPVFAAPDGAVIFENNCAGCHVNGGNIMQRGKNLKLKTLHKNGLDEVEAIAQLVTNGKGLMSAYGDRLSAAEIQTVAAFVLERAEKGWKD
jgi:cytochrome c6